MSDTKKSNLAVMLAGVELEAKVDGVIQKLKFEAGYDPAEILEAIREADANAEFRTEFFTRRGGGNKDTKAATALVLSARITDSGKFITITAHNAEENDDLSISVSKKKSDEWLGQVDQLGKLSDKNMDKLKAAFDSKKTVTVVLSDDEQFFCKYWKTDDGAAFLDSMAAQAPESGNG